MVFVKYEPHIKRLAVQLAIQGFDLPTINSQLSKKISTESLSRWRFQHSTTGDVLADPQDYARPGARPRLPEDQIEALRLIVAARPTIYLDELQKELQEVTGINVSVSTIRRYMVGLGLTLKKTCSVHPGRSLESQGMYIGEIANIPPAYLVFADESAICSEVCYRPQSWAPWGLRTTRMHMQRSTCRFSILPAVSIKGVEALMVQEGAITRLDFEYFLEFCLLPVMLPFPAGKSVLVVDNAKIHHNGRIQALCDACRVRLIYLPPYSPSYNPMEKAFLVLKSTFRRIGGLSCNSQDWVRIWIVACRVLTAKLMAKLYHTSGYM